jgi:hypothetical protein
MIDFLGTLLIIAAKYYYKVVHFFNKKLAVNIDYEKYYKDNNVAKIINSLHSKKANIINEFDLSSYVYIKMWNSRVINLLDGDVKVNKIFQKEISMLERLPNIERALYMFVDPNSDITEHLDDDDKTTYRILIGVCGEGEFSNVSKQQTNVLTKGKSIGVDVEVELHKGKNYTNNLWSVLIVCISKESYRV